MVPGISRRNTIDNGMDMAMADKKTGAEIPENLQPQPLPQLPPEIMTNIFGYLFIRDKERARLVTRYWKKVIDARPEMVFNVTLNSETAKWVRNLKTKKPIESLKVQGLGLCHTDALYKTLTVFLPGKTIRKVIFGQFSGYRPNFKPVDVFWKTLELFENVESLKFGYNWWVSHNDRPFELTLPSVKSLEFLAYRCKHSERTYDIGAETGHNVRTLAETLILPNLEHLDFQIITDVEKQSDYNFHLTQTLYGFYKFLQSHKSIRKVGLSTYQILIWDSNDREFKYPDFHRHFVLELPPNYSRSQFYQFEELRLELNFESLLNVSPLIFGCKTLKTLVVTQERCWRPCTFHRDGMIALAHLIRQNCTTLEMISIESYSIDVSLLGLHRCTSLKGLKLIATESFQNFRIRLSNVQVVEIRQGT